MQDHKPTSKLSYVHGTLMTSWIKVEIQVSIEFQTSIEF